MKAIACLVLVALALVMGCGSQGGEGLDGAGLGGAAAADCAGVELGNPGAWTFVYAIDGAALYEAVPPGETACLDRERSDLCIYQSEAPSEDNALGVNPSSDPGNDPGCAPD